MSQPPAAVSGALTLRRELARKALHITSASVPLAYAAGLPRRALLASLAALLAVALVVELGRARSERVRAHFTRATGALLRAHEHHRWSGATWLLAAFLIAALLFPRDVAVAAMWAVALGDASAAVVGRWLGRHRLPAALAGGFPRSSAASSAGSSAGSFASGAAKTLEGSAACALAAFLGAALVARLGAGASVVAALLAAVAEAPARPLDDNVRVALAVGCGILLWRMVFS